MIDSSGRLNVDVGGATLNVDLGSVTLEDGTTHSQKLAIDASGRASVKQGPQSSLLTNLCSAVTTTGGQASVSVDGYDGAQAVEAIAVGTVAAQAVTFKIEGSFDNSNWYTCGIARVDGQATLTRIVSDTITPGNGNIRQVYAVQDAYKYIRVNATANTLGTGLYANVYAEPI